MVTLHYTISEQEYKEFYYFIGWLAPGKRSFRIKYRLSSILTYLILFAFVFYMKGFMYIDLITIIIFLAPVVGLYYYTNYRMKTHFHRLGKKVYHDSDKDNSEMIIGESGITAKNKDAEAHYKWSAFTKKYETDTAYYLLMATNIGLIIPKRVFHSATQKESFEGLLSQYLPLHADLAIDGN
ncbi:MAG TPA: YcxB family protein [Chitinophagaceae bacterium]